jgi:FlaA1/EpsC-like NDP-sugar epimerase
MTPREATARIVARRVVVVLAHLLLWTHALVLAFVVRFEAEVPAAYVAAMLHWLPALLAIRTAVFFAAGHFRSIWRYTSARDALGIVKATAVSSLLFALALAAVDQPFPRSVVFIEFLLALGMVGGLRLSHRVRAFAPPPPPTASEDRPGRVLVVGAGDAGELLVADLQRRHASRLEVVGFVDDDPRKLGGDIHGVRVLGQLADLPRVVAERHADQLLIAIPTATGAQMRRIVGLCRRTGARFKTIPGLADLVDGQVDAGQLRPVAIEDLLGREPIRLDMELISSEMKGRAVLVTGAGGSIGSELCRQVARFEPSVLVLVERAENALFHVHRELQARFPDVRIEPCVADVADARRMDDVFMAHRPSVVFHAAAHKHVPMMEWNPGEAVTNNVFGTRTLADLAHRHGVDRFVMISTDKAVNPTSVMGTSKRVAEMYVQALSQRSKTRFVTVRFGNVLGSNGSVIPIFQEQIARGGPVTVTHPDMRRYFMTIPEASQLVLQAGAMGNGGEIFFLDMGKPVKIADLARDLITLSGLRPGEDIEIRFTGLRPGEKLFEELSVGSEHAEKTRHPKIFVGRLRPYDWNELHRLLAALSATPAQDGAAIRRALRRLVPEYTPPDLHEPVDTNESERAPALARVAATA